MSRTESFFLALSTACASALIAYAALRCTEHFFYPRENPAVIIWTERSGFIWRIAIALYIAGAALFGSYALALRSSKRASRLLCNLVIAAFFIALLQSIILP